jgi:hypothetical protein
VSNRPIPLPPLVYDFNHARIDGVEVGPRREITLLIAPLLWAGSVGRNLEGVRVRFGGIENFDEAKSFFSSGPHERSELARLEYAPGRRSKPGCLFVDVEFEREESRVVIQCSSVQVSGSGGD